MSNIQTQMVKQLLDGNFSEEVLKDAMMVLNRKPQLTAETPTGFLSEKKAREFCGGIARSTFWQWQNKGLKSYLVGGRRFFLPEDIREFILKQAAGSPESREV